jgi:hypothetical protein
VPHPALAEDGPGATPDDRGPAPRRRWLREPYRRFTLFCLGLTTAVAIVDAVDGGHVILIGLLVIGPGMAIATGRARATALVSLWAIGLAIALGDPDGIWGTHLEFQYVGAVTVAAAVSTALAFLIERRSRATEWMTIRAPDDDVQFLTTAYAGILGRVPDARGLDDQLQVLRAGGSRSDVLRSIVGSKEAATLSLYGASHRGLIDDFWHRRSEVAPTTRPVCFLHTMKTGGTALSRVLVELAGPWPYVTELMLDHLVSLPRRLLEQAMLIAGHLPFEAVDLLPDGVALCAIVRDPVERTLSHHAHINSILASRGQRPVGIEEFVTSTAFGPLWQEYQARQLVHRVGVAEAWRTYSPVERAAERGISGLDAAYPLQSLFDSTPLELHGDELRDAALERLEHIDVVGTTDHLEDVVARIAAGWDRPAPVSVPRTRVSSSRVAERDLSPALVRTIRDATTADAALYERADALARSAPSDRRR